MNSLRKPKKVFTLAIMGLLLSVSFAVSSQFGKADAYPRPTSPVSRMDETSSSPRPVIQPTGTDADNYHDAAWSPGAGEVARKRVYLFTSDFPQSTFSQYPSPPLEETTFWKLLDKEMASTSDLTLTSDPTKADYRVEVRCGGVFNCSRLVVDVKSPERNPLTSFSLTHINHLEGIGSPKLNVVSRELAQRLDERIRLLPQGGYGYSAD
jgi:hypothetical protein